MASSPPDQDALISHFCAITGVSPSIARDHLAASQWDLDDAISEFYPDEPEADSELDSEEQQNEQSAGRTLGGGSAAPQSSTASTRKQPAKKKFATLHDISSGDPGGAASNDEDDDPQDLFAGGEKSGLAVQNPDDIKKKIIEKAKKALPRGGDVDDEPKSSKSYFSGAARTLGGDDAPSEFIEDPNQSAPQPVRSVERTLHFWNDGFSVDDGDLYRSDDPKNAQILEGIRQGRAPLSIMNVLPGQDVDVQVKQHESNYEKPKQKYKPFSGAGQRLGSPTPAAGNSSQSLETATVTPSTSANTGPEAPKIDESQPTITLQIRLGDGTRLTSRFNHTHTIGDVYEFVTAAHPSNRERPWVLMTTFPSTELNDKAATLGDLKEYKRGGVVVQKWT